MNADHDFRIGSEHIVCQDYALSDATADSAYIIVCDGCSASPDVDFGARALAMAARETLRIAKNTELNFDDFGRTAIRRADTLFAIFPTLHPQYLDSTLLIAWIQNHQLTAYLFGDGMFFHKTEKSVRAVHVDFKIPINGAERPAPAYLSYELDAQRKENYLELGGVKTVYDCLINGDKESGTEKPMRPMDPVVITASVSPGDVIALCSDGIGSFKEAGRGMAWRELIPDFAGFKNFEGVFVRRRMRAFQRDCTRKQWSHSDDISLAAIAV